MENETSFSADFIIGMLQPHSLTRKEAKRLYSQLYPSLDEFCKRFVLDGQPYKGKVLIRYEVSGDNYDRPDYKAYEIVSKKAFKWLKEKNPEIYFQGIFGKCTAERIPFNTLDCVFETDPEKIAYFVVRKNTEDKEDWIEHILDDHKAEIDALQGDDEGDAEKKSEDE